MKKFFRFLLILVLVVAAFVLIAGLFIDREYKLERTIVIKASKERIWPHIATHAALAEWSPFLDADPYVVTEVSGNDGEEGCVFSWEGNKEVGAGTQTLSHISKPDRVELQLHFIKPFEGKADSYISQTDEGNGSTKVAWGFNTAYAYPLNVMLLFINMDKMMGATFDKGLHQLKQKSESL